jgi:ABC-2 type transport system permease protein
MNRGLALKTLREVWVSTTLFGLGLFGFEIIISYVLPTFFDELAGDMLQIAVIRNVISALLGTEITDSLGPLALHSIAWVHPVVLVLLWTHVIMYSTRFPVGEVDRGTIDVLLGLPVSRWQVYISETAGLIATGVLLLTLALAGNLIGQSLADGPTNFDLTARIGVLLNLFCLYLAVGGVSYLASCLSDRRGRAIGAAFAIVVASFFLNFLSQFWAPASSVAFLGILHYYRPMATLGSDHWPVGNMLILAGFGATLWLVGGMVLRRRDLHAT